jgi:hypothetical protein
MFAFQRDLQLNLMLILTELLALYKTAGGLPKQPQVQSVKTADYSAI